MLRLNLWSIELLWNWLLRINKITEKKWHQHREHSTDLIDGPNDSDCVINERCVHEWTLYALFKCRASNEQHFDCTDNKNENERRKRCVVYIGNNTQSFRVCYAANSTLYTNDAAKCKAISDMLRMKYEMHMRTHHRHRKKKSSSE